MPEKGWLRVVLEAARTDVNSRPEWQRSRIEAARDAAVEKQVSEPNPKNEEHSN
jgi:hypothetical protein